MEKKAISSINIIVIIIALLGLLVTIIGIPIKTTSHGEHTGTITAIEDDGIIFNTMRVYFKSDVQSSQEDIYCVTDKAIITELQQLAISKAKITIVYEDYLINGLINCKSGDVAIITGVR